MQHVIALRYVPWATYVLFSCSSDAILALSARTSPLRASCSLRAAAVGEVPEGAEEVDEEPLRGVFLEAAPALPLPLSFELAVEVAEAAERTAARRSLAEAPPAPASTLPPAIAPPSPPSRLGVLAADPERGVAAGEDLPEATVGGMYTPASSRFCICSCISRSCATSFTCSVLSAEICSFLW